MQAIGAGGILNEECKDFVKEYIPQILHIIDTMPAEQAGPPTSYMASTYLKLHDYTHTFEDSAVLAE